MICRPVIAQHQPIRTTSLQCQRLQLLGQETFTVVGNQNDGNNWTTLRLGHWGLKEGDITSGSHRTENLACGLSLGNCNLPLAHDHTKLNVREHQKSPTQHAEQIRVGVATKYDATEQR